MVHQTHAKVKDFLRSHTAYAEHDEVHEDFSTIKIARRMVKLLYCLAIKKASGQQTLGALVYLMMMLMFRRERILQRDVQSEYIDRMLRYQRCGPKEPPSPE